jgi:drug/metabolite transporter (DMT)-like permease
VKNPSYLRAHLYIHISVFLWGFTAILGKLISYGSVQLVWHRMLITAAVYFMIPSVWKLVKNTPKKTLFRLWLIGIVVAGHWLTFYGSIKLGNSVSITLACLGSASFFTSLFEPWLTRQPFQKQEIASGLIVVLGVTLISFSLPQPPSPNLSYPLAIGIGIISAALAALFSTLNKKYIQDAHPLTISSIEMLSGGISLTAVILLFFPAQATLIPSFNIQEFDINNLQNGALDLLWLLLLAIVCTNLTFYLATIALNQLSAFTSNLTVNLEPVYGIILGILIFKENQELNINFYLGTLIILCAIFVNIYLQRKKRKDAETNSRAQKPLSEGI